MCHHYVIKAQEAIVKSNNQIMSLNSKAQWLFWEKKALNAIILTAPPQAKAAAKVRKKFVVLQQKTLLQIQKTLFAKGQVVSNISFFALKKDFQTFTQNIGSQWNRSPGWKGEISVFPQKSQLKRQLRDIAPTYKRNQNHWSAQKIKAQWVVPIKELMPHWLKTWAPIHKQWRGECASHPHKGGLLWTAAVGEGNH